MPRAKVGLNITYIGSWRANSRAEGLSIYNKEFQKIYGEDMVDTSLETFI